MIEPTTYGPPGTKLNIGCGNDYKEGWINVDRSPYVKADMYMNVDVDRWLSYRHDTIEEIYMSHLLEHLHNPLFVMQELWLVSKPGCLMTVRVPYGSSDNAWEDQTHVRPYFMGSFAYFSQMYYKGADYGYRGDWNIEEIRLDVFNDKCDSNEGEHILEEIKTKRNMVSEMVVTMRAIKPIRDPNKDEFNPVHRVTLNFI